MGRPREHGDDTAAALLAEAERIVERDGVAALGVRDVAEAAGVATRAVYSLFESKEGLVAALGSRAFGLLGAAVGALPDTGDPSADLVAAALCFRDFAVVHPALFELAVRHRAVPSRVDALVRPARLAALAELERRIAALDAAGGLGGRTVGDATVQFHALCEGLAALELRTGLGGPEHAERLWRSAFEALLAGFTAAPGAAARRRGARRPR